MRPMEGMRVIALEHAVAAPLCSRHLADLGADVIKIERPGDGDFARDYDDYVNGICSHFIWLNRGKRSVTLDVKNPDARAALDETDRRRRCAAAKPRPRRRRPVGSDA
jgi:itaconate CoA-transferase